MSNPGTQAFRFLAVGRLLGSHPRRLLPPSGTERKCHLVAAPGTAPEAADPDWLNSKHAV